MKRKIFNIPSFCFYSIFLLAVLGIVLGSFFDLSISKKIVDIENPLAGFFETFGLFIAYGAMEMIAVLFFVGLYKRKKILWKILGYAALLAVTAYLTYNFSKFLYLKADSDVVLYGLRVGNKFVAVLLAFIFVALEGALIFFLADKSEEKADYILYISLFMAAALALRLGISYILKDLGGRPRYRFLFTMNPIYQGEEYSYANWWEFAFWKHPHMDYFRSWPSGHTMSATLTYLFLVLPFVSKKRFKGDSYIIFGLASLYTLLMMYFRIRIGAHFLSDVSMGLLICSLVVYLAFFFAQHFENRFIKNEINQPDREADKAKEESL